MKYKLGAAILLLFGAILFCVPKVLAHFPAYDKSMEVVLHIDPNDQAVAGQPAKLHFIYDDQLGKFSNLKCDCRVTINEQGRQLFSGQATPITGPSVYGNYVPFTFPKADVYALSLSGSPKKSGDFVPFKVSWNLRVIPDPKAAPNNEKFYIIGFIVVILICAGIIGTIIVRDFKEA